MKRLALLKEQRQMLHSSVNSGLPRGSAASFGKQRKGIKEVTYKRPPSTTGAESVKAGDKDKDD